MELTMTDRIPSKFLKTKILADIPRAEYINNETTEALQEPKKRLAFLSMLRKKSVIVPNQKIKTGKAIEYSFNIAAWMRVPGSANQIISLIISYEDEKSEYSVIVDEAEISTNFSLMLSGNVTFKSIGNPKYLRVGVSGLNPNQVAFVDDLFVEDIDAKQLNLDILKTA
mgnify:CR=1 FL=1